MPALIQGGLGEVWRLAPQSSLLIKELLQRLGVTVIDWYADGGGGDDVDGHGGGGGGGGDANDNFAQGRGRRWQSWMDLPGNTCLFAKTPAMTISSRERHHSWGL